ncbi:MAG: hypothetical protein A2Y00_10460 [Omnitrophica WOR_2 bacterium GWF2_43_52]|nr:MAG: hypothetical protein A2Y00_10460 [Omnitrophica WOR_2 bacterium GWF2_43_52]OGX53472.1 MAG: hypothetical protein A2460_05315 [Omnitrophica WOR_2 bacterium RIFOXYC2_FULL_43_9]
MLVKDIMTKKIISVTPRTSVRELAKLFVKKGISGAPVVEKGKFIAVVLEEGVIFQDKKVRPPLFISLSVGFLTLGVKRFEDEIKKIAASSVKDIMEKNPLTVNPDMSIEDAATLMLEKGVFYLPVLEGSQLVGVVTKKDIVRAIARLKR